MKRTILKTETGELSPVAIKITISDIDMILLEGNQYA